MSLSVAHQPQPIEGPQTLISNSQSYFCWRIRLGIVALFRCSKPLPPHPVDTLYLKMAISTHLAVACPSWQSPAPCPANQSLEFRGLPSGGLLTGSCWVAATKSWMYQTRRPAANSVIDAVNVFPGRIRTSTVGAKLTINT
jgi:hypothetical protein